MKIREIIQGKFLLKGWLTSNLLLFVLVAFLCIIYISNRYNIEITVKDIEACSHEIKMLTVEHTKLRTEYQNSIMMHKLAEKLQPLGVDISREPIKEVIFIAE